MCRLKTVFIPLIAVLFFFNLSGCKKVQEMTLAEIQALTEQSDTALIQNTVSKPFKHDAYVNGRVGGVMQDALISDPKTFNQLIAERDGTSTDIMAMTLDYLVSYDFLTRKWIPRLAFFEIETDPSKGTLTVHYTLRENLFWSWFASEKKVPVTSDDVVFWYNEIAGDSQFGSSAYPQQWCVMPDGESRHVDCVKIDDRRFDFIFPRTVSDPLLATNMEVAPSFLYREAKEKGGAEGVKKLFPVNVDVRTIPSCGQWFITEYSASQRLVFSRNPDYWQKDENGCSIPYVEKKVFQIVGDMNTCSLLFRQGKMDFYSPRPEELSDVIENQKDDYTVYNAAGSMGAQLWSFNQNAVNSDQNFYVWFNIKQFRQAMSCLLNRDRIISQTYRGLAYPKYDFFPDANPMYNPEITLKYRYNPERALNLLESAGFYRNKNGTMCDSRGIAVEFDLSVASSSPVANDIALIIADECSKIGIKVNVRQLDFQKLVEMLTASYDWQSLIIGLGSNLFPSQGSNVWPSSGNLHMWYPMQEKPVTDWEARIDYLYNEGCYTVDTEKARTYWDEYQRIILEQCPVIYLVRPRSFAAVRNRWDLSNVFYDNKYGLEVERIFLRQD